MTKVPLTNSERVALVDDEDAERVLALKWYLHDGGRDNRDYVRHTGFTHLLLHRFVAQAPEGVKVDHWDNDGLNCQKRNLRVATTSQNAANAKIQRNNLSGYKGIDFRSPGKRNPWSARIMRDGKRLRLGNFATPEAAARAYDAKARELFGEFARLNFPESHEQSARVPKETI